MVRKAFIDVIQRKILFETMIFSITNELIKLSTKSLKNTCISTFQIKQPNLNTV